MAPYWQSSILVQELTIAGTRPNAPSRISRLWRLSRNSNFISGLPSGFTGVLDISAPSPFVALTLRSLNNARNDFLLTTFPAADFTQAVVGPLVFPQIADGKGYQTQVILLNTSSTPSTVSVNYSGNDGSPLQLVK
jgi:hypothetical protein